MRNADNFTPLTPIEGQREITIKLSDLVRRRGELNVPSWYPLSEEDTKICTRVVTEYAREVTGEEVSMRREVSSWMGDSKSDTYQLYVGVHREEGFSEAEYVRLVGPLCAPSLGQNYGHAVIDGKVHKWEHPASVFARNQKGADRGILKYVRTLYPAYIRVINDSI